MKLHLAIRVILLIMFAKSHYTDAQQTKDNLDEYIDGLIKNRKPDDNIIVGNNINNRVQNNGKTTIHYNGKDYVKYWNNNDNRDDEDQTIGKPNSDDNIISGNNIRNRVQVNGKTIHNGDQVDESDDKNSPKTKELNWLQKFINWIG
ncbi:glycosyltransferase-like protein gnt13 [Calliphora vicina]|uniref:glycosyltransferase-like protein gnt13 n=1 Tax=Calliphora vicina TaxID=7373 RepID=UPI00325A907F